MTRHARNSTAGSVYTYKERQKDSKSSGFGTEKQRIGKESLKSFDCCNLTLQPSSMPVVTKDGYLFDKEAILQYIITRKGEYNRKMKAYEKRQTSDAQELQEIYEAENKKKLQKFMNTEKNIKIGSKINLPGTSGASTSTSSLSNMSNGNEKSLPSFWVPSQTPDAVKSKVEKPDSTIYCPVSGKPLKAKDLLDVKFKHINDPDDKTSLIAKESSNRYVCAVTSDVLTNSVPMAVIRTTGDVVTMECVEKIIKKDWIHPLTNEKLTEKDIIELQRGGTGFSSTNKVEAKSYRPALQC